MKILKRLLIVLFCVIALPLIIAFIWIYVVSFPFVV